MYVQNLRNWANAFVVLIIPTVAGGGWNKNFFYAAAILILVALAIFAFFQFKNFHFRVENGKFLIHKGVFRKDDISVPFDRIQSVHIRQNLVQQVLNVVALDVETAGSKEKEVSIPALSRGYAQLLKEYLLSGKESLQKPVNETGEEIHEESPEAEEKLLIHLSIVDLLKVGLTENHLRTGLLALAFIWSYINQYGNWIEEDIDMAQDQFESAINAMVYLIPLGILVFVVISILLSTLRTALRFYNLQATLSEKGLTISSGLLKKQENVVPANKIQFIAWKTNPLRKLIGYQSLAIYQASSNEVKQRQAIQIPGCRQEEVEEVNLAFFAELQEQETSQVVVPDSFWHRRMLLFFSFIPAIALSVGMYFVSPWASLSGLLYLVISSWNVLKYVAAYRLDVRDKLLILSRGYIFPSTLLIKKFKLQSVEITQSIFQQRRGLLSIRLYTAGGDISIPFINEEKGYQLYNNLLFHIEKSHEPWM
jgi:putative membrane protein